MPVLAHHGESTRTGDGGLIDGQDRRALVDAFVVLVLLLVFAAAAAAAVVLLVGADAVDDLGGLGAVAVRVLGEDAAVAGHGVAVLREPGDVST